MSKPITAELSVTGSYYNYITDLRNEPAEGIQKYERLSLAELNYLGIAMLAPFEGLARGVCALVAGALYLGSLATNSEDAQLCLEKISLTLAVGSLVCFGTTSAALTALAANILSDQMKPINETLK